jgi:putative MFS transporter
MATIGVDSVLGLLSAFSPTFTVLLVLRFITGFGVGGSLPVDYAIFSEFLPTRQRGRYLVYLESFWALGTIVAATLAWLIIPQFPEMGWRFLLAASAVPGLLVFWLRRTIPESPRFLMLDGRDAEARAVLARIARENGVALEVGELAAEPRQAKAPLATIFDRTYLRTTLMLTAVWFLLSLGYYGLFVWLPGIFRAQGFTFVATFQNTLLLALAQVPGYFSAAWLVERWGRVRTLGIYLAGSAVGTFFFAVLRDQTSIVIASIVMSFFALGAWGVLYAYTPELYPTSARGTGMGWAGGVARIAGVLAPLIGAYLIGVDLAIALGFYALSFAAASIVIFAAGQETMNRPLAEIEHDFAKTPY